MSSTDYRIDDINSLILNCAISPSLKNVEMNQLNDIIKHICDNIIFYEINHDTYKEETTDKTSFMKGHIFSNTYKDVKNSKIYIKIDEFKLSIEDLIVRLDFINTKKLRLEGPKMLITTIIYVYTIIVFVLLFTYLSYKYGGPEYVGKADNYDIGFVSSTAYIYLFSQLKDHYFEYSELQGQMGDYDEKVCTTISNIIVNIKTIYTHLLKLIEEPAKISCFETITDAAVELYERIYIKDVFRQAREHFKTTVNSINSFIDKQKRYLLKVHNTNMDEKNNNEYMEDFYNILLKGHGKQILQVTDDDKPETMRRNTLLTRASVVARTGSANDAAVGDEVLVDTHSETWYPPKSTETTNDDETTNEEETTKAEVPTNDEGFDERRRNAESSRTNFYGTTTLSIISLIQSLK